MHVLNAFLHYVSLLFYGLQSCCVVLLALFPGGDEPGKSYRTPLLVASLKQLSASLLQHWETPLTRLTFSLKFEWYLYPSPIAKT